LSRYALKEKLTATAKREASTRYSYDAVSRRLSEFYRESIEEQKLITL
jgi:YD repeat-containing protein